jgi:UDP-2,4-diacetamido-2,4,6-trideoxy-beta-L-altropyranose hydrolase
MNIAFRVDASGKIGTGHLVRCLTLADALKARGASTRFVCRQIPDFLAGLVTQRGHELAMLKSSPRPFPEDILAHSQWLETSQQQDAEDTKRALAVATWDWVVVDHYSLDFRWESALRGIASQVMVIDDLADRRHDCDVLLDQNYYCDQDARYFGKVSDSCQLLLGPRYALLREEFARLREKVRPRTGAVKRVLVFLGGVDADNYTGLVLAALADLKNFVLGIDVVIGPQHPARHEIEARCGDQGYSCHIQTPDIAELMAQADLAVGAGGTATWERCCLGLPTLTLCIAENQKKLIEDSARSGLLCAPAPEGDLRSGMSLHFRALLENPGYRELISRAGMAAVDGRGVSRVLRRMGCCTVEMRLAGVADSQALYEWRNHPSVRAVSRSTASIPFESHERWFNGVLRDEKRALLIGYLDNRPVGVVRFDMAGDCAEISIYLVPGLSERGMGVELLGSAERWLSDNRSDVKQIRAEVLGDNAPSHGLFNAGGYTKDSTCYLKKVR